MRTRTLALLAAPVLALGLAACSSSTSVASTELATKVSEQITANNNLTTPVPVTCSGDLRAEVGATQTCALTDPINGASRSVTVTVTSVDGSNVNFDIKESASSASSPAAT